MIFNFKENPDFFSRIFQSQKNASADAEIRSITLNPELHSLQAHSTAEAMQKALSQIDTYGRSASEFN